ncbi:hypothetical protein ARSEF4850_003490 [Beauveria asiatica]
MEPSAAAAAARTWPGHPFGHFSFFNDDDDSQGTMTARSSSDPRQLQELLGINMASVFIAIWTLTGTIAIAFSFAWKLALVSFCVAVPILLGTGYWRLRYEREFDEINNAVFADSSRFASEAIGAFRTVASLTLEDATCDRFRQLAQGRVTDAYNKARLVTLLFAFSDSVTIGCQALVLYYGGCLLLSGEYSLQSFFVCFISVLNPGETTGLALSFGPNVAQVTGAANRILSLRNSQMEDDPAAAGKLFKSGDNGMKIELENIRLLQDYNPFLLVCVCFGEMLSWGPLTSARAKRSIGSEPLTKATLSLLLYTTFSEYMLAFTK